MLKVSTSIRLLVVVGAVAISCGLAQAQSDLDWHLSKDGARPFFVRSAFAHGYMHGYEEGFHRGDLDLQMARPFHQIKDQEKFKKICGYRRQFGERHMFDDGYRKGYTVGYNDAYAGRNFRAVQLVHLAKMDELPAGQDEPDRSFDHAFMLGYETGQATGLKDGRAAAPLASLDAVQCSGAGTQGPDCGAYQRGYRVGYLDGYSNQRDTSEVFARK